MATARPRGAAMASEYSQMSGLLSVSNGSAKMAMIAGRPMANSPIATRSSTRPGLGDRSGNGTPRGSGDGVGWSGSDGGDGTRPGSGSGGGGGTGSGPGGDGVAGMDIR